MADEFLHQIAAEQTGRVRDAERLYTAQQGSGYYNCPNPEKIRIGTCSLCGGDVMQFRLWAGTEAPPPACAGCGAHPARRRDDIIAMGRPG